MIHSPTQEIFSIVWLYQTCLIQMPQSFSVLNAMNFQPIFEKICQDNSTPKHIILDMSPTHFIDSRGIGVLVVSSTIAKKYGINVTLWSVRPQVKMALELLELDKVLKIDKNTKGLMKAPENHRFDDQPLITHPSVHSRVKRSLDICGSLIGLLITGILFIPLAILIRLDSPGPILFSQIRRGWMGRPFLIWKFRSMQTNAEVLKSQIPNQIEGALFKNENDPRVTRVGRFLRRTSLDEFPQFWNVLRGEMSLVGTRPPTPGEVEKYEVSQWQRFDVKPGITGEWQVNGRSKIRTFEEVVQLDLKYQENWSVGYDLKLIWKTIMLLFNKDSGAF